MAASRDPICPGMTRRAAARVLGLGTAVLAAGCAGVDLGSIGSSRGPAEPPPPGGGAGPVAEPLPPAGGGTPPAPGQTRVSLLLPLSAGGNAGAAAQSMKNAAELALAEFNSPDVQLDVKDDGGTAQGAQAAARQAIDEGAVVVLGPLFAHAVGAAARVTRERGVPMIAFSTDSNVAARSVYLLSFLPESDVDRIVDYAAQQGKRSFAALLPENPYGSVAEAAFKQAVSRQGGRVAAIARYKGGDAGGLQEPVRRIAEAAGRADALFLADAGEALPRVVQALQAGGVDPRRLQLIGTGLWDDSRVFADPALGGGWFAAPDSAGFRSFATRYRGRYGQDPVRTATLAYDAVALVAALLKQQGGGRITDEALLNPSGFAGIDGVFRFRQDGTNQRGLAVLKVTGGGPEVVSAAPRAFG
ncbi:ABC transporter substrate-binding protein [Rhodoplanes serenus]|uniref:ABC transporter substrate-binding protein n=1 Tax=Rhodoplanes serenus TaxID=200615 RepID=A0A9X4XMV7_9BRAD|nr:penicillin-binding protein activator [Rhodoplanes serenus]MTW18075.1 ABC transporter substrate-binding protein [Rhodoplanes serenus]